MSPALVLLRYLSAALTLSALLTFYLLVVPLDQQQHQGSHLVQTSGAGAGGGSVLIKRIVAYSLKKRIEIESESVRCAPGDFDGVLPAGGGVLVDGGSRRGWTRVPGTELLVFSAYRDDRLEPFRYVRLIGMIKGSWNESLFCQVQTDEGDVHVTRAVRTDIWVHQWDAGDEHTLNPVLISCSLPPVSTTSSTTDVVAVGLDPCRPGIARFRVVGRPGAPGAPVRPLAASTYSVTVCVKPLNFMDEEAAQRLMQWIEMNRIVGAGRFEVFVQKVAENLQEVLDFYVGKLGEGRFSVTRYVNAEDFVASEVKGEEEVNDGDDCRRKKKEEYSSSTSTVTTSTSSTTSTVTGGGRTVVSVVGKGQDVAGVCRRRKLWQKRRNELIAYNDCLYRNLGTSHFVVPVDVDELIVPRRSSDYTWQDTLEGLFAMSPRLVHQFASFSVRNAYFLEDFARTRASNDENVPFFFKYSDRSQLSDEGESGKSFVSTDSTLTVFNHYALDALRPGIGRTYFIPPHIAQMNHYKKTCSISLLPQCVKYLFGSTRIVDTNIISKYGDVFYKKYEKVLDAFQRHQRLRDNQTYR